MLNALLSDNNSSEGRRSEFTGSILYKDVSTIVPLLLRNWMVAGTMLKLSITIVSPSILIVFMRRLLNCCAEAVMLKAMRMILIYTAINFKLAYICANGIMKKSPTNCVIPFNT